MKGGREGGKEGNGERKEEEPNGLLSLCFESLLDPFVSIFPPPLHISLPICAYLLLPLTP